MKRILPIALLLFVCVPLMAGDIQEPGRQPDPLPSPSPTSTSSTASTPTADDLGWGELAYLLITLVMNRP